MSDEKVYVMPETYEEAVQRKQELLVKINSYNEAIFSGEELPFTDEEIDALQEEYQILNDRLALTDEEKLSKLDDKDKIVNEDGTVERKTSFLDKIHWSIYTYPLILAFFAIGVFASSLVEDSLNTYVYKLFGIAYNHNILTGSGFVGSEYDLDGFTFFFKMFFNASWIQLLTIVLAWGAFILYSIFKKDNKKIALVIAIVITVIAVVSITVNCIQAWDDYAQAWNSRETLYDYYIYNKFSSYYGY